MLPPSLSLHITLIVFLSFLFFFYLYFIFVVLFLSDLKAGELIIASKAIACVFSESSEFETDPTPSLVLEVS